MTLPEIESLIEAHGFQVHIRKYRAGTSYIQALDTENHRRRSLGEIREVEQMSEEELREFLSAAFSVPGDVPPGAIITYQLQRRRCGKAHCRVCASGSGHGPYIYGYWQDGNVPRSFYIGKILK